MQILSAQVQLLPLKRFSQTRGLVLVLVGSLKVDFVEFRYYFASEGVRLHLEDLDIA